MSLDDILLDCELADENEFLRLECRILAKMLKTMGRRPSFKVTPAIKRSNSIAPKRRPLIVSARILGVDPGALSRVYT